MKAILIVALSLAASAGYAKEPVPVAELLEDAGVDYVRQSLEKPQSLLPPYRERHPAHSHRHTDTGSHDHVDSHRHQQARSETHRSRRHEHTSQQHHHH